MAWRVARSLDQLLAQLNARAPRRSKASDGSIGDAAHSSRGSDHNPDATGIVRARDFTHDPAGGLDCHWLAGQLVAARDPRVKYIIWNRRILSGAGGPSPWVWRTYSGPNPHTKHLHLSVVASAAADTRTAWNLGDPVPTKEDPVQNLILAREADGPRTWVGDGMLRRHVADPAELDGLKHWIKEKGGDPTVQGPWKDLRVLGLDIAASLGQLTNDEANIITAVRQIVADDPDATVELTPEQVDQFAEQVLAQLPAHVREAVRQAFARAAQPEGSTT